MLGVIINGLRDANLRRELMAKRGLDWDELTRLLKARSVARQAVEVLDGGTGGTTPITKEVSVVSNITRSSSYTASDYCNNNNNSSHSVNYVNEAERNARGRRRDSSRDRSSVATDVAGFLC